MNRKILKFIKTIIIVLFIATLILSMVVSQDRHHLETCHKDHCSICTIIHIAQNIINLSIAFIICIVLGFLVHFFLSRLHKEQTFFVQSSLVFQKVQMNE